MYRLDVRIEALRDPVCAVSAWCEPVGARSSAGRAPRSQCGGREFDPPRLHQPSLMVADEGCQPSPTRRRSAPSMTERASVGEPTFLQHRTRPRRAVTFALQRRPRGGARCVRELSDARSLVAEPPSNGLPEHDKQDHTDDRKIHCVVQPAPPGPVAPAPAPPMAAHASRLREALPSRHACRRFALRSGDGNEAASARTACHER